MNLKKMKKVLSAMLVATTVVVTMGCGQEKTQETKKDLKRPEAVTEADWEAMKKEPAFGEELNYLFNGGACVSAKYLAEQLGYYKAYGINAKYKQGNSVVETVGTGKCLWGTDHIATMLVPVTKGVDMTFVTGAHIGCKSIFVPKDSKIQTVQDLKGKNIAIHDGIGNSDQNICYRLLDEYGLNPTKDVKFTNVEDSAATIAAMENGEIDATIFSDYFVLANYRDDMRMICSITFSPEFQDEPCCVTAMNNKFLKENPVHAKYIVKAIKRAGEYARLKPEESVDIMYKTDKMTGKREDQLEFWNSLYFGLSDAFTKRALREVAEDYVRLGIIENKDLTPDKIMEMAWTEVCPDEEIEGLTVGDPVAPKNPVVEIKQYKEK